MTPRKPALPGRSAPAKPTAPVITFAPNVAEQRKMALKDGPVAQVAKAIGRKTTPPPPARGKIGHNSGASDEALDAMFEDSTTDVQGKDLARISTLINEATDLNAEMEAMMEQSATLARRLETIKKQELPDLLQQAGVKNFTDIETGTKVTLEMWVSAKWPKTPEGVKKALAWLKKVGAEDLVKCNIEATYTKGHAKAARDAVATLKKLGAATVEMAENVHSSTLPAFLKERIEQGLAVELDLFEGTTGTRAKIKPGKEKKK